MDLNYLRKIGPISQPEARRSEVGASTKEKVKAFLLAGGAFTGDEIARQLEIGRSTVNKVASELVEDRVINRKKVRTSTHGHGFLYSRA